MIYERCLYYPACDITHFFPIYIYTYIYHWTNKIKNKILYGALERLSNKIRRRRLKFAGHCLRREDEVVSDLVLWQPTHGTRMLGRQPDSYIKTLERDTGLRENDIRADMMNRDVWKSITVRESIKRIPK